MLKNCFRSWLLNCKDRIRCSQDLMQGTTFIWFWPNTDNVSEKKCFPNEVSYFLSSGLKIRQPNMNSYWLEEMHDSQVFTQMWNLVFPLFSSPIILQRETSRTNWIGYRIWEISAKENLNLGLAKGRSVQYTCQAQHVNLLGCTLNSMFKGINRQNDLLTVIFKYCLNCHFSRRTKTGCMLYMRILILYALSWQV